jgi:RimJ/RimL family protein N-acetyltransferase
MHPVYGTADDSVGMMIAGYFTRNTGYPVHPPFTAMGWVKDGELVGQMIFNNYTGANLDIHLYFPGGGLRKVVRQAYDYVFNRVGCVRLTAKVYSDNQKLLRLLNRLGFVYECTQKDYYLFHGRLIDAEVYKLTLETIPDWVKYGRSQLTSSRDRP